MYINNNMFRCHSLIWVVLVWTFIFAYTLMTHLDVIHIAKTMVLCAAIVIAVTGAALLIYQNVTKHTKMILWFVSWFVAVLVGVVFFSEKYISDLTLNIWFTAVSALASVFWCVVSHTDKITEPGLHWYVFCLLNIVVICSVFNATSSHAIAVYITNCALLTFVNVAYLVHICQAQAKNSRRCRQITRVCICFVISVVLLFGSILHKTETLSQTVWSEYIMSIQVAILIAFLVDGIIGFSQNDYKEVPTLPVTDDDDV